MGEKKMRNHTLEAIETESLRLMSLTFLFSSGARAPPEQTYPGEPLEKFMIPHKAQLQKVRLGYKNMMSSFDLIDAKGEYLLSIGNRAKGEKETFVNLRPFEKIVGVEVETQSFSATSLKFFIVTL